MVQAAEMFAGDYNMTHVENPESVSVVENHGPGPGWLRGSPVRGASYIVPDKFRESEKPHNIFLQFFFFVIRPFIGPFGPLRQQHERSNCNYIILRYQT